MTRKLCEEHFKELIRASSLGELAETVVTMNHSLDNCDWGAESGGNCGERATKLIYEKGEFAKITLPGRKQIISQMLKELTLAIETGCIVEFSASEKFFPNMPQLTEYKFLADKQQLVQNINDKEENK